ncbi:MAG TPA: hypothetical protein VL282_08105 [Tepidisphaeraceae bacterium]|jgi:hypothetical protein|nr:hypothetical protein [Tepidisphaeraceae bacterium]
MLTLQNTSTFVILSEAKDLAPFDAQSAGFLHHPLRGTQRSE